MRNDDLTQSGNHHPTANDDYDVIPAGSGATATGNTISGRGTISGAAGADDAGNGGHITAIVGAGGSGGSAMEAAGRYGSIKIDAQGNYTYARNHGSPDNVEDVFTYTLADRAGELASARLIIRIEGEEEQAKVQDNAQRIVAGNQVINLPAGVELSDIHVVGRDLVIDLPDGTQMVITDGAVFVPQLALGDVELPADTLASLLIDSEPRPAAGPPQSSGGNFGEPVAPLDPGVPLGDLLPPTELDYQPPEFEETYIPQRPDNPDFIPIIEIQPDGQPASTAASDDVDEGALPARPGEPAGSHSASADEAANGNIVFDSPDGVQSISITINDTSYVVFGPGAVTDIPGDYGTLHINSVDIAAGTISYTYTLEDNVNHQTDTTPWEDFKVQLVDGDGDVANATLRINIADDVPTANSDVDSVTEDGVTIADGNVFTGTGGVDSNATDGVADVQGADGATVTGVSFGGVSGALGAVVHGTYGDLVLNSSGQYVYTLRNGDANVQALHEGQTVTDVFNYTITDGDGDTSTTTLTITVTGTNDRPVVVSGSTAVTEEAFLAPEDHQGNPDNVGNPTDTATAATSSGQLSITDGDGDALTVTLSAPAGDFYSHGLLIDWAVSPDGHTLTGSTTEGDVITVTIDNSGHYTVNLLEQIDHPLAGTSPATSEDIVDMVVGVHVNDGTVTVDGSLTVHVEDDSPIVTGDPVTGIGVDLDESDSGTPVLSPAGAITVSSTGAVIGAGVAYGGDGPGGEPVYTISLNGAVEGGVDSGLVTADGDHPITLIQVDSTHIDGVFNDGSEKVAFSVTINADGSITVTQNYALEHSDDGSTPIAYNDTNSPLTLDGLITAHVVYEDFDHDTVEASGNIGQLIRFFDDGPSIDVTVDPKPENQQAIDALALTTQDAGTEGPGSTTDSDSVNLAGLFHSSTDGGADGTASTNLSFSLDLIGDSAEAPGIDSGLQSHDATIYLYQIDAHTIIGSTSATPVGADDASVVFALTTTDGGDVTLTQYQQIDHDTVDPTPGGAPYVDHVVSLADGLVNLVATGSITDNDGDTASDSEALDLGGLVRFQDDGPDASIDSRYQGGTAILDETRAEGTDTPGGSLPNGLASTTINFAGAFVAADYGADGAGSTTYKFVLGGDDVGSGLFALEAGDTTTGDMDGYGQGDEIVLNLSDDGLTVTGSAGGVDYFTLVMNPTTGQVTFTQLSAIWHPTPGEFDELAILTTQNPDMLQVQQTVVDFDGDFDTATVNVGQGVFGIQDDGPDPFDGCPDDVITINDVGATFTGDLNLPNVGEDQPGVVSFGVVDGDPVLDTMGHPISSGGEDLYYFLNDGGVLEARAGGESGDVIFTITLNGDGTFTYDQVGDITSESELSITDLSSVGGGNVEAKAIDVEGSPYDLILSTKAGTTVNTNATEIGIGGGNSFQAGEVLRVDLVQNAFVTGSGGGAVLNFGEYYTANSYRQDVSGLGGAQTASFTVKAIAVNEAPGSDAADPADGDNAFYGDANDTFVTGTTLNLYDDGGNLIDPADYGSLGITVTALADGWQIEGLPNDYDFQIVSDTSFNAVQVEAIAGTDTFKLGFIDITSTVQSDVDLQVPIALTDADGDAVSCDIDIHLGAPANVPGVNATVFESGLPIGSDAPSNSEMVAGELSGIVSGGTGPYTYAIVGSGDGTFGTLTIDPATGHFEYVLDTPVDSMPDANDGTNIEAAAESFTYSVTDANGVVTTSTININIVDDVPMAVADGNSVDEGATLTVDAASGVLVNDEFGADGKTVPTGGVVGVRAAGGDTTTAVQTGVNTTIHGAYGDLVLQANGSYSYHAFANTNPPAGATDTFVYSIKDGDGDISTTTLTIDVNDVSLAADNQTKTVYEAALDTTTTGSDLGHGSVTGSKPGSPNETVTGTLNVAGATSYVPVDQATAYGIFHLNADGTYTYTLTSPYDTSPDANNGSQTVNGVDSFNYTALDANGNSVNGTITIDVVDDVPTARADTDSVAEGANTIGNVLTGAGTTSGVAGADTFGADGPSTAGQGVVGVATGSNVGVNYSTNVGVQIDGTYGKLTLNADGSYTYVANPNSVTSNQVDHFVYTIKDGDGDLSTVTLDITVNNVTLAADNQDKTVNEAALDLVQDDRAGTLNDDLAAANTTGSDPASSAETVSGQLAVVGATTYAIVGSSTGSYGQIHINADGSYTYTLTSAVDGDTIGQGGNNSTNTYNNVETFTYTATDANGNSVNGTITIDVVDDVPTARADTDSVAEGANTIGNVLTGAGTTSGVAGADTFGADGPSTAGQGVVGVATGSNVGVNYSTNVGVQIDGTYGKLTLNADGSYTYVANPNSVTSNQVDHFVYTIKDGDGDLSTVTLDITVNNVTLAADNQDKTVNEAALDLVQDDRAGTLNDDLAAANTTGSDPASSAETVSGQLAVVGATTYAIVGSSTGSYGQIHINADGSYTYTLTSAVDGDTIGQGGNNSTNTYNNVETFTYTATDANGNSVNGTITIDVVDDVPTARADTDSVAEGANTIGNVLTGAGTTSGVAGADTFGADGPSTAGGGVVGVATGSNVGVNYSTNVGVQIDGTYGKLTLNADGSYTYVANPNSVTSNQVDHFVYTIKDGDGDLSTVTLDITVNNVTLAADNQTKTVYEAALDTTTTGSDLGHGSVTGSNPGSPNETVTGTLNVAGATSYVPVDQATAYGIFHLNADGTYTYTLTSPYDTSPDANNGSQTVNGVDSFNYTALDANGNSVNGTITINVVDDVPTATNDTAGQATENAAFTIDALANDKFGADNVNTSDAAKVYVSTDATQGHVTYDTTTHLFTYTPNPGAGSSSTSDSFQYTIIDNDGDVSTATVTVTLKPDSTPQVTNAVAKVDDEGLANGNPGGTNDIDANVGETAPVNSSEAIFHGQFVATGGGDTIVNYSLSAMNGQNGMVGTEWVHYVWNPGTNTLTAVVNQFAQDGVTSQARFGTPLYNVVVNPTTGSYTVTLLDNVLHPVQTAPGDETSTFANLTFTVTDSDGDPANGTLAIEFNDDTPVQIAPTGVTVINNNSAPVMGWLDADHSITDNLGADGGKAVFSLSGLPTLTANGGSAVHYSLSSDGQTLTAYIGADPTIAANVVFTAHIDGSQYTIDMNRPLDSLSNVDFLSGDYAHNGGNPDFYAFYKTAVNPSADLLLTPVSGDGNSVNLNGNVYGIGQGNDMNAGDVVRLDFVTDITTTGTHVGDWTFVDHYNTNGASVGIAFGNNSTARFTAYDDTNGNQVVGDGTIDPITQVAIKYGAGSLTVTPTTTYTAYTVGGHEFWVILNGDGSVSVGGLTGTANGSTQSTVAVFTATGYNSMTVGYEAGAHGTDTFKIGGTGAAIQTNQPVPFDLPVHLVDGDGDTTANVLLHVTANPASPPVVLDTNHDGQIGFLGMDAGVLYDMNGDNHLDHTAWAAAGDSILFRDADGNGTVSNATEFVFGHDGMTDLEALHTMYGTQLDGHDADFTMFALWNDANSNGIVDAGEVQTLAEAGITSISLVSDGIHSTAADGDVSVNGMGEFAYVNDNGETATGRLADASFSFETLSAEDEQRLSSTATNTSLLAIAAAAAALAGQTAAASTTSSSDEGSQTDSTASVMSTAQVANDLEDSGAPQSAPSIANDDAKTGEAAPAAHHNAVVAGESDIMLDSSEHGDAAPQALPQIDGGPVVDSTPLVDVAPMTVMAEAAPTHGVDQGGMHHNAIVGAGELIQQPETMIEAVLAKIGGDAAIESLAQIQGGAKAVQGWDMGDFTHLPIAAIEHIGAEASLLHPDAVQPVMHG